MPFDNTTALVEAPDLTTPSLAALSYVLRHKEAWPPGHRWDYTHCRTCAVGIYKTLWPEAEYLRSVIGIYEYTRTFCHHAYRPIRDPDVTPTMVADRIDAVLARSP